jgi:hypothetical protein
MATQRVTQVKGIDCTVDTFAPSRSNPVARRAVRKYYAQQPLMGTQTFDNLTFQVQQSDPLMVINEIRMVLPLELQAYNVDGQLMSFALANGGRACNIAVGQDAPFSAFSNIEVGINGKIYSEQPQRYGKTLSKCFQSYSEMQFQNNHSLKPICNTSRETTQDHDISVIGYDGNETGDFVTVRRNMHEQLAYALPLANSGFLARSRAFQENLRNDGYLWKGEINSLLNCAIFNCEARKQSNDQVRLLRTRPILMLNSDRKQSMPNGGSFLKNYLSSSHHTRLLFTWMEIYPNTNAIPLISNCGGQHNLD